MALEQEAAEAYREEWSAAPSFSGGPMTRWPEEEILHVMRKHLVKALPRDYEPSGVESAIEMPAGDCVVFAMKVWHKLGRRGSFGHNGDHGALIMEGDDDSMIVIDSTAKRSFSLKDGETFHEKQTIWLREGDKLFQKIGAHPKKIFNRVSAIEAFEATNVVQRKSKTIALVFHNWDGGKGGTGGLIKFFIRTSQIIWEIGPKKGNIILENRIALEIAFEEIQKALNGQPTYLAQWNPAKGGFGDLILLRIRLSHQLKE